MRVHGTLVWSLVIAACGSPLGPDRGDPARFILTQAASYSCGAWSPRTPAQPLGLFDIYFTSGPLESGRPPAPESLARVVQVGGTIVQPFQVNGTRAILPVRAVSRLNAALTIGVLNAHTTGHPLAIGFNVLGKESLIIAQGGHITWMASTFPDFYAIVPDTGIPALRSDPDLRFLELSLPSCNGFD